MIFHKANDLKLTYIKKLCNYILVFVTITNVRTFEKISFGMKAVVSKYGGLFYFYTEQYALVNKCLTIIK